MYQFDRNYAEAKLTIGAVEFTSSEYSIETIKITNGCYDGNAVGVGSVYIRHAEVTMERIRDVQKGTPISISFKVNDLWRGHGEYYVKEVPVVNGDKMTLQLQGILSKFEDIELVFSGGKQTYTLNDMKEQVESITGCQVVFLPPLSTEEKSTFLGRECCFLKDISTFVNGSDEATGVNVRSALSGLATLFGGNVYEDHGYIYIKSKTYHAADSSVISKDDISGDYSFSQLTYAVRSLNLSFLPWSITGMFNPPNTSSRIFTTGYQGNERVSNLLLGSQITDHTLYDYTIECDWLGWTSDGSKFDHNMTPGGRVSACLRQGDLVYKSGTFNIIGYEITGQIKPGNIIKFEVQEETDPINIYCGEVTLEWDGGFKTTVSCNCNIEEGTASSSSGNSQALIRAAEQEAKINLYKLKFADIELSNIKDSTISGSIFKDGTIEGSKIKESTITGSLIADSTIKGSNIEEGTITGSLIKAATITGSLIVNGTIRNEHIMDSAIDNSKIANSSITDSKIENSSITGSKFKDGTIENSKIKDATLTGAKIKDATIGFEKVNTSFIKDLTADEAYITDLKAKIADIGYLTADEADVKYATIASLEAVDGKIDTLESKAITTDNLSAKVADLGYLNVETADLKYANIALSNIDVANVGTLFANVGLLDRATIVDGHVTGFLDSVEVNANKITAGTLVADRILLKGSENGLLYALNNLGELTSTEMNTLDGDVLTDRTINADKIIASSITTNELDVDDIFADSAVISKIFAQNITATGVITGATLVGASISADRGTIGGFSIFDDCLTGFYDEDGYQYKVDLNTAKSITGKNGGVIAIEAGKYKISPYNIEHEWYVTYDGYMYAELGEIAGFNLKDKTLASESEVTPSGSAATYYYNSKMNSQFNGEEDFLTLSCIVNNITTNKAIYGLGGVILNTSGKIDDYYDKWMHLSDRSIAFGVDGGETPYNGSATAFKLDTGYAPSHIEGLEGTFTISPSCEINVSTTIRSALRVESDPTSGAEKSFVRINNHEVQLHAINSSVNFYLSAYSGSSNKFKLYSTTGNIIDVTDTTAMTITPKITASNGVTEQGYGVIGCTITTSGNFTCKKYRDGRLIIEWKKTLTAKASLSSVDGSIHYTAPQNGTISFPAAFTATPGVVSGLAIPDLSIPFCTLTIEGVTKTSFARAIVWNTGNVSNSVLPSGTVVSATFTGRWK